MATLTAHDPAHPSLLDRGPTPQPPRETLEDRIAATWGSLVITHAASCPLCSGELAPRYSAGARPVAGRCRSCDTELS